MLLAVAFYDVGQCSRRIFFALGHISITAARCVAFR